MGGEGVRGMMVVSVPPGLSESRVWARLSSRPDVGLLTAPVSVSTDGRTIISRHLLLSLQQTRHTTHFLTPVWAGGD